MKRPLMWLCLTGMIAGYLIYVFIVHHAGIREYSGFVTVCGTVRRKEVKSGANVYYLKNVSLIHSEFPDGSVRHFSKEKLKYGIICTLSEEEGRGLFLSAKINSEVILRGKISVIPQSSNPGEFDARTYYLARGYGYRLYQAGVEESKGGNTLLEWLYVLRRRAGEKLTNAFGERDGGILSAMLFGEKEFLSADVKELYRAGGISHILAISGLHISMIGTFLFTLLLLLPMKEKVSFIVTMAVLILYGFMVGFGPSVFRALFMFGMKILAKQLQKSYDPATALMLSGFLICIFYPGMSGDTSFLLSHLAVGGILLITPVLLPLVNKGRIFIHGLYGGVAVFLSTIPVMVSSCGRISFAGLLLNLLVLPAMPVLFACSFFFLFTADFLPRLAGLFKNVIQSILFSMEKACDFVERKNLFTVYVKVPGIGRIIIYTTLVVTICILAWMIKRKMKLKYYMLCNKKLEEEKEQKTAEERIRTLLLTENLFRITFFLLLGCCFIILITTPKKSEMIFLDVGQGDGIFIRTPSKTVCMIDGGSTSKTGIGERILIPCLEYEGEHAVDYWFLTHADMDHVSGMEEVMESETVKIENLVIPYAAKEDFAEIISKAKSKGIRVIYAGAGDLLRSEKYAFTVLSPKEGVEYEDRNEASLILLYETKKDTVAFMGDGGLEAEDAVMEYLNGRTLTLLKCAHHGSANGTNSTLFYQTVRPKSVVISCGRDNLYGHPHKETLENIFSVGAKTYRTDQIGAVTL